MRRLFTRLFFLLTEALVFFLVRRVLRVFSSPRVEQREGASSGGVRIRRGIRSGFRSCLTRLVSGRPTLRQTENG